MNVWRDPWIIDNYNFLMETLVVDGLDGCKVSEFIDEVTRHWNINKLQDLLLLNDVEKIVKITLSFTGACDKRIWHHSKSIVYTFKIGYHVALNVFEDRPHLIIPSLWCQLWRMQVPPKC